MLGQKLELVQGGRTAPCLLEGTRHKRRGGRRGSALYKRRGERDFISVCVCVRVRVYVAVLSMVNEDLNDVNQHL